MQPTDSYFPRLRLVSDRAFSDEEPSAIEEPSAESLSDRALSGT